MFRRSKRGSVPFEEPESKVEAKDARDIASLSSDPCPSVDNPRVAGGPPNVAEMRFSPSPPPPDGTSLDDESFRSRPTTKRSDSFSSVDSDITTDSAISNVTGVSTAQTVDTNATSQTSSRLSRLRKYAEAKRSGKPKREMNAEMSEADATRKAEKEKKARVAKLKKAQEKAEKAEKARVTRGERARLKEERLGAKKEILKEAQEKARERSEAKERARNLALSEASEEEKEVTLPGEKKRGFLTRFKNNAVANLKSKAITRLADEASKRFVFSSF